MDNRKREVTDKLCDWCHEEYSQARYIEQLCYACRMYRTRTGALPSDDVLSKRYGWPV